MNTITLAFIGVGDVATRDYLPEFHRIAARAEIVAMCGRTPDRVRDLAGRYGARAYTDYRQMLAETEAQAVVNLTPVQLHYETNLATLQAGKHLYSEKTVAGTVAEARQLQAAARARNLVFVCAPCVLIWPQFQRARALIDDGVIGEVYSAHASLPGAPPPWHGYTSDPTHFFAAGAGPVRDMGVYALHPLTALLGAATRVSAFSARTRDSFVPDDGPVQGQTIPIEVDDNWHVLLDHGHGCLASLTVNVSSGWASRAPQVELIGTRGTLGFNAIDVAAPLSLFRTDTQEWEEIAVPITGRASGPDHIMGVEHLIDCIEPQRPPVLSIDHALHVIEIIARAEESAAHGRSIAVESTF